MTDDDLDEYLAGDSRLPRLYRRGAQEEPPEALDRAVQGAARRALRRRRGPTSFGTPWPWAAALAAVLVVAVSVSLWMRIQTETRDAVRPQAPAEEEAAPAADATRPPPESTAPEAAPGLGAPARREGPAARKRGEIRERAAPAAEERREALGAGTAAQTPSPEAWVERIEALLREGRVAAARESLARLRAAHPEYTLPESLRRIAGEAREADP